MPPIHRSVDDHPSNTQDSPSYDLSIRGRASGSRRRMTPLSRSDRFLRLVRLRQRFVRRCHDGKGPDPLRPGQVGRADRSRIRPFPPCIAFGPNIPQSLCPRPRFCSSAPKLCSLKPTPTGPDTKTFEIDQSFEPGARTRRPTDGSGDVREAYV